MNYEFGAEKYDLYLVSVYSEYGEEGEHFVGNEVFGLKIRLIIKLFISQNSYTVYIKNDW